MNLKNNITLAVAGSGKTRYLINEALKIANSKILITTYTKATEEDITEKILVRKQCIPSNIKIQSWISFLFHEGAKPYLGQMGLPDDFRCTGINIKYDPPQFTPKSDIMKYYFDDSQCIYSSKLTEFIIECNRKSGGWVISRIEELYSYIFIDEIQDLAGYDLDLLRLIFNSKVNILGVGDPRQAIYLSNSSNNRNKQYRYSNIINYFEILHTQKIINLDKFQLSTNYRSCKPICNLANKLHINFPGSTPSSNLQSVNTGVFYILINEVAQHLSNFPKTIQLRYNTNCKTNSNYPSMNMGLSKGLEFDTVILYPTKDMLSWFNDDTRPLPELTKNKLYIAITRAKQILCIVTDKPINNIPYYYKYLQDNNHS